MKSELKILQNMSHRNIIRLHEFIEHPEKRKLYLVLDYLNGGTIADKIKSSVTGIPSSTARDYFRHLLSAIHYCHEVQKIAHRDIKPENLMLASDGRLILCDFGISEFFKKENDLTYSTAGTMRFLAPEAFLTGNSK